MPKQWLCQYYYIFEFGFCFMTYQPLQIIKKNPIYTYTYIY